MTRATVSSMFGMGLSLVTAIACAVPASDAPAALIDVSVAGALNRMPSLAVSGDRAILVWTATIKDVMAVYVATSDDAGVTFSPPRRISDSKERVSANAEQPPRVAMSGEMVGVIWPSRIDGRSSIRLSQSTDGGRTFSSPKSIHDALTGMRGWQGLTRGRQGAVHAVWLDGRHAAPSAGSHRHHTATEAAGRGDRPPAPRQDVYAAVIQADGSTTEAHVARDVCFCCKTAAGIGPSGRVYVAWRHIFPESIRDIALAISDDGGRTFSQAARVSKDDWKLSGCPDDGPSLAVDTHDTVHLAWPTLMEGENPQKAVFYSSTRDGVSFALRTRLSSETVEDAGHPQIAVDAAGNVAATWDEQADDRRNIVMRVLRSGGGRFGMAQVLTTNDSGFHPFVAGLERGFLIAWTTGSGEASAIRVRRIGM